METRVRRMGAQGIGRLASLGAPLAALVMGCGAKTDPDIEASADEMAKAICPRAYECCTPMQLMDNAQAGTDEASCESATKKAFRQNLQSLAAAQKKNRLVYHRDKLSACASTIRTASCAELDETNHLSGVACEPWVEPLVAPGGACSLDAECVASFCRMASGAEEGTCVAFTGDGAPCADGDRCAPGSLCRGDSHVCFALRPEGAACGDFTDCATGVCSDSRCAAAVAPMCFYASACSWVPRPRASGLLTLAALAWGAWAASRRRRQV